MNRFKQRNFDNHHEHIFEDFHDIGTFDFSNFLYDTQRGISTMILKYSDSDCVYAERPLSDVEMSMSQDPVLLSQISPQQQAIIKQNLASYTKPGISSPALSQLSDEEIRSFMVPNGLTLDERSSLAKRYQSIFNDSVVSFSNSMSTESSVSNTVNNVETPNISE